MAAEKRDPGNEVELMVDYGMKIKTGRTYNNNNNNSKNNNNNNNNNNNIVENDFDCTN